jgi:hypothetical protein
VIRLAALVLIVVMLTVCGSGADGRTELGRVRGIVLLGPTGPVESSTSPCPDRPLADALVRAVGDDGRIASQGVTDAAGRFELALAAGDYSIRVDVADDPVRSASPVDAHVEPGRTTSISVTVDSGIR